MKRSKRIVLGDGEVQFFFCHGLSVRCPKGVEQGKKFTIVMAPDLMVIIDKCISGSLVGKKIRLIAEVLDEK